MAWSVGRETDPSDCQDSMPIRIPIGMSMLAWMSGTAAPASLPSDRADTREAMHRTPPHTVTMARRDQVVRRI